MKDFPKANDFDERNLIYIMKGLAIFSVICAHCGNILDGFSQINQVFSKIIISIGAVGIGVFFLFSGYLMGKTNKPMKLFLETKITTILIPWLVCGTAVYTYVYARKDGISFVSWFNFVIGNQGYLYFLSVIMFFYIFYFSFRKNDAFLIITILLSILSNIATSFNILDNVYTVISPYINPFNWMMYFSAGLLICKYDVLARIVTIVNKLMPLITIVFTGCLFIIIYSGSFLSYWRIFYIPIEIIAILFIFGLAYILLSKKSKALVTIGKETMAIYLLHMPIAGIVANIFNRVDIWWTTPLRPFIVLSITIGFIFIYKTITDKLKISEFANMLIGTGRYTK